MNPICIITALPIELLPFLEHLENRSVTQGTLTIHEGTLCGIPIAAASAGMGKVNAALSTQFLIDRFAPSALINTGAAGALDNSLRPGDLVIADSIVYHDLDPSVIREFPPFSSEFFPDGRLLAICKDVLGQSRFGRFATGDAFIAGDARDAIARKFSPLCVDMETAAVAHVCYVNAVPFLALRAISDSAEDAAWEVFEQNVSLAASAARDAVIALLSVCENLFT